MNIMLILLSPINYGSAGTEIAAKLYSRWLSALILKLIMYTFTISHCGDIKRNLCISENIRDIGDVPTCVKQQLVSHVNAHSVRKKFFQLSIIHKYVEQWQELSCQPRKYL